MWVEHHVNQMLTVQKRVRKVWREATPGTFQHHLPISIFPHSISLMPQVVTNSHCCCPDNSFHPSQTSAGSGTQFRNIKPSCLLNLTLTPLHRLSSLLQDLVRNLTVISHKLIERQKCEKSIISEIRKVQMMAGAGWGFVASLCQGNRKYPYLTISIVVLVEPHD